MKNFILILSVLLFTKLTIAQSLSIEETISYINSNISNGSKISLSKKGVLTYSTLVKDYTLRTSSSYEKEYQPERVERLKVAEIIFNLPIGALDKIEIFDPTHSHFYGSSNFVDDSDCNIYKIGSEFGSTYRTCLKEWTVKVQCNNEEVHHLKKGDCVSVKRDLIDKISTYNSFERNFDIRTKDGFKKTAEKIRNALVYLIDLAKQKGLDNQEIDEDPFASNNFNLKKFNINGPLNTDIIKLKDKNGVYLISVKIGSNTSDFILDSGASDVLISKSFESQLIEKGTLKKEDYLTDGLYKIADGSIIRCRRLIIPELQIGSFTIKNVRATVNNSSTMLLGKSVLDNFKTWNIDNLSKSIKLTKE